MVCFFFLLFFFSSSVGRGRGEGGEGVKQALFSCFLVHKFFFFPSPSRFVSLRRHSQPSSPLRHFPPLVSPPNDFSLLSLHSSASSTLSLPQFPLPLHPIVRAVQPLPFISTLLRLSFFFRAFSLLLSLLLFPPHPSSPLLSPPSISRDASFIRGGQFSEARSKSSPVLSRPPQTTQLENNALTR